MPPSPYSSPNYPSIKLFLHSTSQATYAATLVRCERHPGIPIGFAACSISSSSLSTLAVSATIISKSFAASAAPTAPLPAFMIATAGAAEALLGEPAAARSRLGCFAALRLRRVEFSYVNKIPTFSVTVPPAHVYACAPARSLKGRLGRCDEPAARGFRVRLDAKPTESATEVAYVGIPRDVRNVRSSLLHRTHATGRQRHRQRRVRR